MPRAECFLDTNILIHYQPPDQVDWLAVTGASEVVLTLCVTVIHELDELKTLGKTVRLRKRAQDALRRLTEWAERKAPIRERVTLRLIPDEPSVDWAAFGLDREVRDDRIIASVLRQRLDADGAFLVTADLAPRLKAQARGIPVVTLADNYRQPDLMGEQDQEEERLRQRLDAFERREPKLTLHLVTPTGRATRGEYELALPTHPEGEVERLVQEEERSLLAELAPFAGGGLHGMMLVDPADVKRFREAIPQYIEAFRAYLAEKRAHDLRVALTLEIGCVVANTGYAPGEGIHVALHVPDGPVVYNATTLPKAPLAPHRPTRPLTAVEKITSSMNSLASMSNEIFSISAGPRGEMEVPRIKKINSYRVDHEFGDLQHGFELPLPPIYCRFEGPEAVRSFSIDYAIRAKNVALPIEGRLDLIVTVRPSMG